MNSTHERHERAKRIVVKIGSSTLVGPDGKPDEAFIEDLARQIACLHAEGIDAIIVTSGAIAAGLAPLGFKERPKDLASLQAAASVGQVALLNSYTRAFARHNIPCGQLLLTRNDTGSRSAYLHARATCERLLEVGGVAIVNENDTVSVDEIRFGDNDSLAAIVGCLVEADLVVLLSDIEGLFSADPHTDPEAHLIGVIETIDDAVMNMAAGSSSKVGTGGMLTKVRAGRALQLAGIPLTVCAGRRPDVVIDIAHGKDVGTRFVPSSQADSLPARKLWIGYAGHDEGSVVIDDGARDALHSRGGSLLPVGILQVEGNFSRDAIIAVRDRDGVLIARGIAAYSGEEARLVRGMRLEMVGRVIPALKGIPFIHRDQMLVF